MRIEQLKALAREKLAEVQKITKGEDYNQETVDNLLKEVDEIKTKIANLQRVADLGDGLDPVDTPEDVKDNPTSHNSTNTTQPSESKGFNAAYQIRYGDEGEQQTQVMRELLGNDYRQKVFDQEIAFSKYLRYGTEMLDRSDVNLLKTQIFPFATISQMIKSGLTYREIKTTMVEAQGSLGGYAVPPQRQSEVVKRLPGLTAVRGNGATTINLDTGNGVELLKYTGGDDRYVGNLRGQWGSETQSPTEQNATIGLVNVTADVYTYKVPMSQSLVEDATNLVSIVMEDITDTLAIDEDEAFLIGDGVGKPLGILPGSANSLSLTEIVSGSAAAITADGLMSLRRGIAAQYRNSGQSTFIMNSDTAGDIEQLRDDSGGAGTGPYMFPALIETGSLLRSKVAESEAMPDVAANAFAIIYGNLAGYYIVERTGMTIARYQDSNTGPNKVEFHVRRRVGGRLVKPWMFAVQKVAAS